MNCSRLAATTDYKLLDQSTVPQMTDPASGQVRFPPDRRGHSATTCPGNGCHDDMVKQYATTVRDFAGNRLAPRSHWWDIHCTHLGAHDKS